MTQRLTNLPDWVPYVAPMALFLLFTFAEGQAPLAWYAPLYGVKVLLVTIALIVCGKVWRGEIRPDLRVVPIALLVGLAVCAEWVLLDNTLPYPHLGTRTAYNPFTELANPAVRYAFLAVRLYGLSLLVPVLEEVFWRSFLLRYITDMDDFKRVPLGTFSLVAFAVVAVAFALIHPEWLVALLCAVAYGLLLRKTGSLFACIVAHATTNLALGVYVLATGDWKFW